MIKNQLIILLFGFEIIMVRVEDLRRIFHFFWG